MRGVLVFVAFLALGSTSDPGCRAHLQLQGVRSHLAPHQSCVSPGYQLAIKHMSRGKVPDTTGMRAHMDDCDDNQGRSTHDVPPGSRESAPPPSPRTSTYAEGEAPAGHK
jgi:hypothetical protein